MKFFVTCGSGLSPFFKHELSEKFGIVTKYSEQILGEGKVYFEVPSLENDDGFDEGIKVVSSLISKLKSVERLFGFVLHEDIDPKLNLKTRRGLLSHYFQVASKPELVNILEYWANVKPIPTNEDVDTRGQAKRSRLEESSSLTKSIGFRVNSRLQQLANSLTHSQEVSKTFGTAIVRAMSSKGWRIKLKNPDLEIMVNISNTEILMGIPLTSKPISERNYLEHIPLRSTVCYAMASLLFTENVKNSTQTPLCILDPMCGAGTILVEIAKNFGDNIGYLYGMERDDNQFLKARENLVKAEVENILSLVQGDCRSKIFQFKFDSIVCDLPFGKQHGTVEEIKMNLDDYLRSFDDNLQTNGNVVLLISEELEDFLEKAIAGNDDLNWTFKKKFPIKQGVLPSVIFLFQKIS